MAIWMAAEDGGPGMAAQCAKDSLDEVRGIVAHLGRGCSLRLVR
jgi:acetate kinase